MFSISVTHIVEILSRTVRNVSCMSLPWNKAAGAVMLAIPECQFFLMAFGVVT